MRTPEGITVIPTVHQEVLGLLASDELAAVEKSIAAQCRFRIGTELTFAEISYIRAAISVCGLTTQQIRDYLVAHRDALITFGTRYLSNNAATNNAEEFASGEEQDASEPIGPIRFSTGFAIKIVIYHHFLTQRTQDEFHAFLKNRRYPHYIKFAAEISRVLARPGHI